MLYARPHVTALTAEIKDQSERLWELVKVHFEQHSLHVPRLPSTCIVHKFTSVFKHEESSALSAVDGNKSALYASGMARSKLYTPEHVYLEPHVLQADRELERIVQLIQHARFIDHLLPDAFRLLFVAVVLVRLLRK